jgi:hypothetical protein
MIEVPVLLHVAQQAGLPVADEAFLATQLEHANLIYRSLGITFVRVGQQKLAQKHARLVTRADRDALRIRLQPGVLNCFIVASLMDVDEPERERRGVHWRVRKDPRRHFVVVSAIAFPWVLAHELGHFLGNPQHSDVPGNLMSYERTDAVPFLDDAQQTRVLQTLAALFESGELARNARH